MFEEGFRIRRRAWMIEFLRQNVGELTLLDLARVADAEPELRDLRVSDVVNVSGRARRPPNIRLDNAQPKPDGLARGAAPTAVRSASQRANRKVSPSRSQSPAEIAAAMAPTEARPRVMPVDVMPVVPPAARGTAPISPIEKPTLPAMSRSTSTTRRTGSANQTVSDKLNQALAAGLLDPGTERPTVFRRRRASSTAGPASPVAAVATSALHSAVIVDAGELA